MMNKTFEIEQLLWPANMADMVIEESRPYFVVKAGLLMTKEFKGFGDKKV
jgi:hypothetical protein